MALTVGVPEGEAVEEGDGEAVEVAEEEDDAEGEEVEDVDAQAEARPVSEVSTSSRVVGHPSRMNKSVGELSTGGYNASVTVKSGDSYTVKMETACRASSPHVDTREVR